jgi:hypothetical protein
MSDKCSLCQDSGKIEKPNHRPDARYETIYVACPDCLKARLAAMEAESDGRRRALLAKSEEACLAWTEKERAESEAASLRARVEEAERKERAGLDCIEKLTERCRRMECENTALLSLSTPSVEQARARGEVVEWADKAFKEIGCDPHGVLSKPVFYGLRDALAKLGKEG